MKRVVVLGGAGDMGRQVVQTVAEQPDLEVLIADYRLEAAQQLAQQLGDRVSAVFLDARDPHSCLQVLQGAQVAVGCVGPFYEFALPLAQAALQAGVSYIDLCDDHTPLPQLLALEPEARAKGITLITGLGWTPGLSNLLAKKGAQQLEEVDTIKIAWVGSSGDSQGLAVIKHLFYAITGKVPFYQNGEWRQVPALGEEEQVEFPGLGRLPVFACGHPEPVTLPRYLRVRNVSIKGTLYPLWNARSAAFFVRLGLTRSPRRIDRLARFVHRIESLFRLGAKPLSGVRVDVIGSCKGQPQTLSQLVMDRMARLTGIPAAVGALLLVRGELNQPGVWAPEGCLEPDSFLKHLERYGIQVQEYRA